MSAPSTTTTGHLQRTLFDDEAPLVQEADTTNLRHPQSTHELRLNERLVGYMLRRARRRSIGMVVTPEGLRVSAPRWVAVRDIESALRDKAGWILAKLAEQRERTARVAAAKVVWRHGAVFRLLGEPVTLVLDHAVARGGALVDTGAGRELRLALPPDAEGERVARALQKWLRVEAMKVFEERCTHYAARMGVKFTRLSLSSARTRWGSASSSGSIRLHWRLIHFSMPTLDYVVVHELAHLREMNHSARFWAIVADVLPEHEAARHDLKTHVLPVLD